MIPPEEQARLYREWHEHQFERVKFEPKPRAFLGHMQWVLRSVWLPREVNRKAWRLFFWGVMVFMTSSSILLYYGDTPMPGSTLSSKIGAGLFLLMVIANFVIEFGWGGGDKTR